MSQCVSGSGCLSLRHNIVNLGSDLEAAISVLSQLSQLSLSLRTVVQSEPKILRSINVKLTNAIKFRSTFAS